MQESEMQQKDLQAKLEELKVRMEMKRQEALSLGWRRFLDERQRRLVSNCTAYSQNDPAGLPGHNLCLIVAKLTELLDSSWSDDMQGNFE